MIMIYCYFFEGSFTPPPPRTHFRPSELSKPETLSKQAKPMPKLKTIPKSHGSKKDFPNEDDSHSRSRFPLTGSYGGIVSVNNESMNHERQPTIIGSDSGFLEQPSRSIILRHHTSEQEKRNKREGMNNFFQQEQHLANCVRLIAADMEEFEKEPENRIESNKVPDPVPFFNINTHSTMIPNSEIFKGTCADDSFGPKYTEPLKFPSQPLDLSLISPGSASISPRPSSSLTLPQRKTNSPQEKGKRKRVRKQTEPLPMNIMPMTPMPHMSKDDDAEADNEPSTDSGIASSSSNFELNNTGPERILVAPKKRKRAYQQNNSASSPQSSVTSSSVEDRPKTTSPPSLIPIHPTNSSNSILSMPLLGDIENPSISPKNNFESISVKQEISDNEDRELGLVIDTDGEED